MRSVEDSFTTCININAQDHSSSCHVLFSQKLVAEICRKIRESCMQSACWQAGRHAGRHAGRQARRHARTRARARAHKRLAHRSIVHREATRRSFYSEKPSCKAAFTLQTGKFTFVFVDRPSCRANGLRLTLQNLKLKPAFGVRISFYTKELRLTSYKGAILHQFWKFGHRFVRNGCV